MASAATRRVAYSSNDGLVFHEGESFAIKLPASLFPLD